jgi:thymidylate synthase (FAD)
MRVILLSYTSSKALLEALRDRTLSEGELLSHLSYVFAVEGISRVCSHQLVRHRVASYSQQSQRYVEVERLSEYVVVPKTIQKRGREAFDALVEEASRAYRRLIELGVPREDARFVLPNATETHLLVTMDGRSLLHFFGLRCCLRAQWEIRELADAMLLEVRRIEPELFRSAGPYCYQLGYCPEGRFTCGMMEEVRERYSALGYEAW